MKPDPDMPEDDDTARRIASLLAKPAATPQDQAARFLALRDAAEADGREIFCIALTERHAQYLRERAAQHGEAPERHLETILRVFRAHHDDRRPDHLATLAATRRA
jgi:hypothetical protein